LIVSGSALFSPYFCGLTTSVERFTNSASHDFGSTSSAVTRQKTHIGEIHRTLKKQVLGQNENLPRDFGSLSPKDSQNDTPRTGLLKYAQDCGINASLVLMAKRYVYFGIVGASGIGVDMVALFVLADPRMLHLNLSLGKALAAEIAIFSNFMGNELWTFRDLAVTDPSWRGRTTRLGKFNLICLAGIALSVLLLNIQSHFFQMNMYVGNLIAIVIVSLWNFGMNQKFGWKKVGT
jgi:putative flippase GtrA